MHPLAAKLLDQKNSNVSKDSNEPTLSNKLFIPLVACHIKDSKVVETVPIPPLSDDVALSLTNLDDGDHIRVTFGGTGGEICSFPYPMSEGASCVVDQNSMRAPFHIPTIPETLTVSNIPSNPMPHVVGVGLMGVSTELAAIREQYWVRLSNSISVAARQEMDISYTVTTGVTRSESTTETQDSSVSASVSAGLGPFSASVSASLSVSSSHTQSVEMRDETTSTVVQRYKNEGNKTQIYITWQMMDRITLVQLPDESQAQSGSDSLWGQTLMADYYTNLMTGAMTRGVFEIGLSPTISKMYPATI